MTWGKKKKKKKNVSLVSKTSHKINATNKRIKGPIHTRLQCFCSVPVLTNLVMLLLVFVRLFQCLLYLLRKPRPKIDYCTESRTKYESLHTEQTSKLLLFGFHRESFFKPGVGNYLPGATREIWIVSEGHPLQVHFQCVQYIMWISGA